MRLLCRLGWHDFGEWCFYRARCSEEVAWSDMIIKVCSRCLYVRFEDITKALKDCETYYR